MKTVRKIFTTYVVTDEYRIVRNNVFKNYEVRNRKTSETEKVFKTLKEAKNYIGFYGDADKEIKENPKGNLVKEGYTFHISDLSKNDGRGWEYFMETGSWGHLYLKDKNGKEYSKHEYGGTEMSKILGYELVKSGECVQDMGYKFPFVYCTDSADNMVGFAIAAIPEIIGNYVDTKHRRKGIASEMHDRLERANGKSIGEGSLTDDGEKLRQGRKQKEAKNYIGFYGDADKEIKENPKGKNMKRMRRNPEGEAQELYNKILNEFKSEKHYSWDVFDNQSETFSIEQMINIIKNGSPDMAYEMNLMEYVGDQAYSMSQYWLEQNAQEEFEQLEDLDSSLANELQDEIRFKCEELANYNYPLPSPLFITDPNTLRKGDNYLQGPYYAGEEAKEELKIVKKLGKKYGFSDKDCEEVYMNSQGGNLGIAIITDEIDELFQSAISEKGINISGDCVLYIHDGLNGSGHYVIRGTHTIKTKNAKELLNHIDYGSYSLGDVFGTNDWTWE